MYLIIKQYFSRRSKTYTVLGWYNANYNLQTGINLAAERQWTHGLRIEDTQNVIPTTAVTLLSAKSF